MVWKENPNIPANSMRFQPNMPWLFLGVAKFISYFSRKGFVVTLGLNRSFKKVGFRLSKDLNISLQNVLSLLHAWLSSLPFEIKFQVEF